MMSSKSLFAVILVASAGRTSAELITFDEFDATNGSGSGLTTEYADLGMTFVSFQSHTWDIASGGSAGFVDIVGSNGPQFLGVGSPGQSIDIRFDADIFDVQLDVASALFASSTDEFTITGYLNNQVMDTQSVSGAFGSDWTTIMLTGQINRVVMSASGRSPAHFGVDNMSWQVVPAPSSIAMLTLAGFATTRRRR